MEEKVKGKEGYVIVVFEGGNYIMVCLFRISLEFVLFFLSYYFCFLIGVFRSFIFNVIIVMLSLLF